MAVFKRASVAVCTGASVAVCTGASVAVCTELDDFLMGCYIDGVDRDLNGGVISSDVNTPELCIRHCREQGFLYAAVQWSEECFCGNSFSRYGSAPEFECNLPCPGDTEQMCGGDWRQNVYITEGFACGRPPHLDNAQLSSTTDSSVTYTCNEGYTISGSSETAYRFTDDHCSRQTNLSCFKDMNTVT
ncbi:hypothetical protein ScPMuIL_017009 [Solemya velum]